VIDPQVHVLAQHGNALFHGITFTDQCGQTIKDNANDKDSTKSDDESYNPDDDPDNGHDDDITFPAHTDDAIPGVDDDNNNEENDNNDKLGLGS
jgi:hypothetical protein